MKQETIPTHPSGCLCWMGTDAIFNSIFREVFNKEVQNETTPFEVFFIRTVNINWIKNLTDDDDRVFLPSNELRTLYEEAGIMADKEIVTHCQTGIRAAHSYFTLRLLGYPKVRLYDGSWAEWGNDRATPIVSDLPINWEK